jgi:hypothetical protein
MATGNAARRRSRAEVETCVELAYRLGFLDLALRERFESRTNSVGRLLSGLFRSLEQKIAKEKASS